MLKPTSPENLTRAKIKLLRSLHNRKGRGANLLYLIEGEKVIKEAVASGVEIVELYSRESIGVERMARICNSTTPPPYLAVAKIVPQSSLSLSSESLYLALDSISDPGNLGTILRVAEWFGVEALFLSPKTVDIYNSKVVQSAMGSLFRSKIYYHPLPELLKSAKKSGLKIYGAELQGDSIYQSELTEGGVLVMGSESHGLSKEVGELIEQRLHIPTYATSGKVESLNVAIATGILLSHFRK